MVIDPHNGINPANPGNTRGKATTNGLSSDSRPGARGNLDSSVDAAGQESVSLSREAQTLNRLESAISAAPEVDSDRVEAIKQALTNGSYDIDPGRIAERLLQSDDLMN
ncbi:MAG: flagellar biosynthesis anti-sigma factor FlgM [Exilibacterium sp.]